MWNLFARLLGSRDFGVDEDFFVAGGDSLRAIELVEDILEEFDVEIPLERLLTSDVTVAAVAAWIAELGLPPISSSLLWPVKPEGGRPPLVLVEPSLAVTRHLLPLLDVDQPLAGLRLAPLEKSGIRRIERLAATLAAPMVEPDQPKRWALCGHSFNGLLAYAIAHELTRSGSDVPLLIMVDTIAPHRRWLAPRMPNRLHFRRARQRGWREGSKHLRELAADRRAEKRNPTRPEPEGLDRQLLSDRYRPPPFHGRCVLFATDDNLTASGDAHLGWGALVPDLEVRNVQGSHRELVREPFAEELASLLAAVCASF